MLDLDKWGARFIELVSVFTGRNYWLRIAAAAADRDGDHASARELRSHIIWRQMKGLR